MQTLGDVTRLVKDVQEAVRVSMESGVLRYGAGVSEARLRDEIRMERRRKRHAALAHNSEKGKGKDVLGQIANVERDVEELRRVLDERKRNEAPPRARLPPSSVLQRFKADPAAYGL